MPRTMSAKGAAILSDLPPWYAEDEISKAIINAVAAELQRIEDFGAALQIQVLPQYADDTYGILGLWEALFGLPVKPPGVDLATRRQLVQVHVRKRSGGSGGDWEDAVTQALNTNQWTYQEGPGSYQVTVRFPYGAAAFSSAQALALISEITPAHLQVSVGYNQGWLVGIALVGVDVL